MLDSIFSMSLDDELLPGNALQRFALLQHTKLLCSALWKKSVVADEHLWMLDTAQVKISPV